MSLVASSKELILINHKLLKKSKGIKVLFSFQLMFKHLFDVVGKEKFIVNYTTKVSIITNESEIMDFINNLKGSSVSKNESVHKEIYP